MNARALRAVSLCATLVFFGTSFLAEAQGLSSVADLDDDGVPSMLCIPNPPDCSGGADVCTPVPDTCSPLPPPAGDNCPNVTNSDQSDVDGDNVGDLCDIETGYASCHDGIDNDGDGFVDGQDSDCAPKLTVIKQVINDNGLSAVASDFRLHVDASTTETTPVVTMGFFERILSFFSPTVAQAIDTPSIVDIPDFSGSATGTVITFMTAPANFLVSETETSDYGATYDGDCRGKMDYGDVLTCTVINDDTPVSPAGSRPPACSDGVDNDGDKHADYPRDRGCMSSQDDDESGGVYDDETNPTTTPKEATGTSTSEGSVLGASTSTPDLPLPPGCSEYITGYMKYGRKNNDPENVKKLQQFLNDKIGSGLEINGNFGPATKRAVKKFQMKFHDEILKPWIDAGFSPRFLENGTGFVYITTKRAINMQMCSTLNIPMPEKLELHRGE